MRQKAPSVKKYAHDMRPRQYARLIAERPVERRQELLARVPAHLRDLVSTHLAIQDMWNEYRQYIRR